MTTSKTIEHGNFTGLASNYSKYRPRYSNLVLESILNLFSKQTNSLDLEDIGAGTGIWTRKLAEKSPHSLTGIEPNLDMLNSAKHDSKGFDIDWIQSGAENTQLPSNSADLISMASSFHWTQFETTLSEFHRILKEDGYFIALWNPRNLTKNPLLSEIESYLQFLKPNMKRVSSGSAASTEVLMNKLKNSPLFSYELYLEDDLDKDMTPEEYVGVWESVNDVKFQLGDALFEQFIDYIKEKTSRLNTIKVSNTTRAWVFKKMDS